MTGAADFPAMADLRGTLQPVPRRIRGLAGGRLVFDTTSAVYVWETPKYPHYLVPEKDVVPGALAGLTVRVYDDDAGARAGLVRFRWSELEWFEEDEQVFVHPRNPYTRVDAVRSTRHVRVELAGHLLAESRSPVLLFETGLPTRYYLDRSALDLSLLRRTDTVTVCPYKGETSDYWTAEVPGRVEVDVAWSYRQPFAAVAPIAGLVAFYNDRVDLIVDGVRLEPAEDRSR